eukprot:SAG22_NODE_2708_length_2293_cov_1.318140_3_plen_401_part_00
MPVQRLPSPHRVGLADTWPCLTGLGLFLQIAYHTDTAVFMERHGVPWLVRCLPWIGEGVAGSLANASFTVSKTYRRKLQQSWALHGGNFHRECWGPMVDPAIFGPAVLTAEARAALRNKLTYGADGAAISGGGPRCILLVYAGRISSEKGLDFCVKLLERARAAAPAATRGERATIHMAFMGAGPQEAGFAALASAESGLYFVPKFVKQAEVAAAYSAADAYISGSEFETLGFGAIEAMACGAAALVPRAQGFQDTVEHGVTGYLYTPGDLDDGLACLGRLVAGEVDAAAMAKAGASFSLAGCTSRALAVYEDVVASPRGYFGRAVCALLLLAKLLIFVPLTQLMYYAGLTHAMEPDSPWQRPEGGRVAAALLPLAAALLYLWFTHRPTLEEDSLGGAAP